MKDKQTGAPVWLVCDEYASSCGRKHTLTRGEFGKLKEPPLCSGCGLPLCTSRSLEKAKKFFGTSWWSKLYTSLWIAFNLKPSPDNHYGKRIAIKVTDGGARIDGKINGER